MHQFEEKQNTIPWKYNPRSIGCQCQAASYHKCLRNNVFRNITLKEEHGHLSTHTEKCEIRLKKIPFCHEPVGHPTLEYRHQHQQYVRKHLRHSIQRYSSRHTLASQSLAESSSSSPSNISTYFFHLIFSGWNKKSHKLFAKLQPKPKSSPTSRSRSYFWQLYHQNKNSTEKPAGKLLRWSSSNRGGSIEKKQFDREYRLHRNRNFIKRKQQQQQQQRTKQNKHIELLFYNAFVKNALTARKH